jgi:hypothetical protein
MLPIARKGIIEPVKNIRQVDEPVKYEREWNSLPYKTGGAYATEA